MGKWRFLRRKTVLMARAITSSARSPSPDSFSVTLHVTKMASPPLDWDRLLGINGNDEPQILSVGRLRRSDMHC